MKAGIYCRISDDPEDRREGVDRQERLARAHCERNGWTVGKVYTDSNHSAYQPTTVRPAWEELLADAGKREFGVLLALHQDRLTRNPHDLERLREVVERTGLRVVCIDGGDVDLTSSTGVFSARMVAGASEFYSRSLSEKVTRWHVDHALRGRPAGTWVRPFGYRRVRDHDDEGRVLRSRLVVDHDEAEWVRKAAEWIIAGAALGEVCRRLNDAGVTTVTGKQEWRPTNLRRMMTHPRLAGHRTFRGEIVGEGGEWEPILTDEEHAQVVTALRERTNRNQRPARTYLLSGGLLRCGLCGEPMHGHAKNGRPRYTCRGTVDGQRFDGCGRVSIAGTPLEDDVLDAVAMMLAGPGLAAARADIVTDDQERAAAVKLLEGFDATLTALADDLADGKLSRPAYYKASAALEDRAKQARAILGQRPVLAALDGLDASDEPQLRADLEARRTDRLNELRAVLDAVVDHVTVTPAVVKGRHYDPDRVTIQWRA